MTDIHIVRDYPHAPAKVWRAVTDPELVPLWTATGHGGRPVGFAPVPGTRFQFVAKPYPGWRGIVDCEVLEAREPSLLRFSWKGEENGQLTYVSYRIEPHDGGTRFTFDHTGFTGPGGFFMARLLGSVRKKMLTAGLPAVLDDLDDSGALRASLEVAVLAAVEGDGDGDAERVPRRPDQPLLGPLPGVVPEQRDAAGAVGRGLDQQPGAAGGQHPVVAAGVRHRDQLDRAVARLPEDVQHAARPGGLLVQPAG